MIRTDKLGFRLVTTAALGAAAAGVALPALAVSYLITWFAVPLLAVKVGVGVLLAAVAMFLATRPAPTVDGQS